MDSKSQNDSYNGNLSDDEAEDRPLLPGPSSPERGRRMSDERYTGSGSKAMEAQGDSNPKSAAKQQGITRERLFVVIAILATELCERLTYYSVVANMVLFCTSMLDYSSDDASVVTLTFSGTVYLIPVLGGYVSDTMAGKYNTILGSGLIYVLGLFLLPASAIDYRDWFGGEEDLSIGARKGYFFTGLVFVAIGTGGIKANVGPFGAQQIDDLGEVAVQSFFNWFYWFINAGAVVAYSGVAYVQQEIGFDFGFLIPLISMIIAILIFIAGKSRYKHVPVGGSVIAMSLSVCRQSVTRRPVSWRNARKEYGGTHDKEKVDGVIAVMRILPVFLLVIVYWAVYSQMSTSLFLQSERMNIKVGGAQLPAAILNIFNTLIILILIPIMDLIVYPLLKKINKSPSHLQRIGIGMVLAACSMLYAGMLEIVRKNNLEAHGPRLQTLAGDDFNASELTMFAQIPEFAFIGSSEVFASISGLEFAYTQAPTFMQGLIMGLFLMTSGLGSYVASAIVKIVGLWKKSDASDWFPKEPNNGHLEYILFLLAALTMVNLLAFVFIAKCYKYKEVTHELLDEEEKVEVPTYVNRGHVPDEDPPPYAPQSTKL